MNFHCMLLEMSGGNKQGMARNDLLEIVTQLQKEINDNNSILGSVTYDGLAPTPDSSGKYTFSTGSDNIKCTWVTKDNKGNDVTGVGTFVSSGDEVIVVKNLSTDEYEYHHIAISISAIWDVLGQIDGGVPSSVYGGCGVVDGGSASTIF